MLGRPGFEDHLVDLVVEIKRQQAVEYSFGIRLEDIVPGLISFPDLGSFSHPLVGPLLGQLGLLNRKQLLDPRSLGQSRFEIGKGYLYGAVFSGEKLIGEIASKRLGVRKRSRICHFPVGDDVLPELAER